MATAASPYMPPPVRRLYVTLDMSSIDDLRTTLAIAAQDAYDDSSQGAVVVLDVEWRESTDEAPGYTRLTANARPSDWRP